MEATIDIEAMRQRQLNYLEGCRMPCYYGFMSSALGQDYFYANSLNDRYVLIAAAIESRGLSLPDTWTALLKCKLAGTDKWGIVPHTAAQIQEVAKDGYESSQAVHAKYAYLLDRVISAQTVEQLEAVKW